MTTDVIQILDPEIVNPSTSSAQSLEFWTRMHAWSSAHEMRLGPLTLAALGELVANPPTVRGLPAQEFWTIVGKFISRGVTQQSDRVVCDQHVRMHYTPSLGATANVDILVEDLKAVGPGGRVALGTDAACWSAESQSGCLACDCSAISHVLSSDDPRYSRAVAQAWRLAFLEAAPASFAQLRELSPKMFPAIEFGATAWDHLGTLSGREDVTAATLARHLAALNDHAADIWTQKVATADREAALGSLGVTASLEGPRTHRNKSAMKARDFEFRDGIIRCEWHTKLNPNIDRLYFAVTDAGVKVGSIVDHLPL